MKSRTLHYRKQILSLTCAFVLSASLMMVAGIGSRVGTMPSMTTQQVFAQTVGETSQAGDGQQAATTGQNMTTTAAGATNATTMSNATAGGEARIIMVMPTEMNETYRWTVNDTINPTITLVANVNNTITVDNPTDAEHELIIATVQGGEEVAATEDLEPGGHGELSIMPNATDSLRYYCEYHPDTMLGDILITNGTTMGNATTTTAATNATTMTNQTQ
jgi:hypothetical protein